MEEKVVSKFSDIFKIVVTSEFFSVLYKNIFTVTLDSLPENIKENLG